MAVTVVRPLFAAGSTAVVVVLFVRGLEELEEGRGGRGGGQRRGDEEARREAVEAVGEREAARRQAQLRLHHGQQGVAQVQPHRMARHSRRLVDHVHHSATATITTITTTATTAIATTIAVNIATAA